MQNMKKHIRTDYGNAQQVVRISNQIKKKNSCFHASCINIFAIAENFVRN